MSLFIEKKWDNLWIIKNPTIRSLLDLQYLTIRENLKRALQNQNPQRVLDFGSGDQPWKSLFPNKTIIKSLDPHAKADYRSLREIPVGESFDIILLIEVLEHLAQPEQQLKDLQTYAQGELWISVPFAARIHQAPEDYCRWTPKGIERLLQTSGWRVKEIRLRGGNLATIANKYLLWMFTEGLKVPTVLITLLLLPGFVPLFILAHWQCRFDFGVKSDPLGLFIRAEKS